MPTFFFQFLSWIFEFTCCIGGSDIRLVWFVYFLKCKSMFIFVMLSCFVFRQCLLFFEALHNPHRFSEVNKTKHFPYAYCLLTLNKNDCNMRLENVTTFVRMNIGSNTVGGCEVSRL